MQTMNEWAIEESLMLLRQIRFAVRVIMWVLLLPAILWVVFLLLSIPASGG